MALTPTLSFRSEAVPEVVGTLGPLEDFENLPRRLFLDSNVLQMLSDYGGYIWDNIDLSSDDKILKIKNGIENLAALRRIIQVDGRANSEFALSANSLREVAERGYRHYLQWALDVLDHWMNSVAEYEDSEAFSGRGAALLLHRINSDEFLYMSTKDRKLIFDAVMLECDAFLTMDTRLKKSEIHIHRRLGLTLLQPFEYWHLLEPWAALYY